jgi:diguanylate cyclase
VSSINRNRPCLYLFAAVTLVAVINALAPWGKEAALHGETVLQLVAAGIALMCGVGAATRVSGMSRCWRLAYVSSLVCWLIAQALRVTGSIGVGNRVADSAATLAFVLCPVFSLAALLLLGWSGRGGAGRRLATLPQSTATNVLDGLVASLSFLILAAMGGFVHQLATLSPSLVTVALQLVFVLTELAVVGTAVVMAMLYDPDRPYRSDYLFLAGGMVAMAASYRVLVYLHFVGAEAGVLWAGVGFIVGQLLIANALLDRSPQQSAINRPGGGTDWARLILPYLGFLGIAVLFTFHVLTGRPLGVLVISATLLMVVLATIRQAVVVRAQWLLTRRLHWAVHHDTLTGLPNRILFAQLLNEAARDRRLVLIFIDLDDFKEVNDRYGYAAGDELLRAVGSRLTRCVSEEDTLARIGGDEFAILTHGEGEQMTAVADRIRVTLREPFVVHGSSVRVRASIGVVGSGSPDSPQTSDDLLRRAVLSMFAGKQHGKDRVVVYQPSTGTRVDFPDALRDAKGGAPPGFQLVYQQIVRLPEGTPVAVEALARWTAPNGMRVSPETFVGAAEAAGMGAALDALVLDLACREIASAGLDLDIHVNVGAARLGNTGFDENVRRTLERHRIDPRRLVVEITETVPIVDIPDAAAHIRRLNDFGVSVALDDFGTGYNSLTYLHTLPIRIVKLDRSLAVGEDPARDLALYRSVMKLCDDLGFNVIAEGIETAAQADIILAAGCRFAQGHLYGRPVPISELRKKPTARGASLRGARLMLRR